MNRQAPGWNKRLSAWSGSFDSTHLTSFWELWWWAAAATTMEFLMQPIRGSTFLEEVGESLVAAAVLAEPTVVDMLVEHQVALQETAEHRMLAQELLVGTVDAQILAATEAAAERRDNSPPSSELSTGKMNPVRLDGIRG
ncbi:uncharacterized protein LOC119307426 [Triticum dicoccoides]|uniref:uncharacterized protein LOC119307426 n=1 Tax=Triticum dicoccoides TaxID=85692 RepID=UPI000E788F31|nr:uncharacterized protein LOC119307426 [Triticum dicoccoides]XP_037439400.1 uncharacterized protein LOC119307426 [Triticum dicoccoides]